MAETDRGDVVSGAIDEGATLAVVCGLPGVGKTTVAERVADRLDGRLLRTDVVRKDLFPDPEYTDEEERTTYDELLSRARETLASGRSVVLDGTFYRATYRGRAKELAGELDAGFRLVKVECPARVVEERIASRTDDESDADFEVHQLVKDRFDPVSLEHVTVDNADGLGMTRRQLAERF